VPQEVQRVTKLMERYCSCAGGCEKAASAAAFS
jgi:hypothetical protein